MHPHLLHHLGHLNFELVGIHLTEVLQGETPGMQTRTETNGTASGIDLDDAHGPLVITIGGNDDVDRLDDTLQ